MPSQACTFAPRPTYNTGWPAFEFCHLAFRPMVTSCQLVKDEQAGRFPQRLLHFLRIWPRIFPQVPLCRIETASPRGQMAFIDRLLLVSSVLKPRRAPDVSPRAHCQPWPLIAIVVLAFSGCQKPDEITRYTVAKPPPREGKPADVASSAPKATVAADVATEDGGKGSISSWGRSFRKER